jgi:hypothetical protein
MKYQNYQLIWTEYHSINHSYLDDKGYIKSDDESNILVAHQNWENVVVQKFSPEGQLLWVRYLKEILPVTNMSIYYLTEFELDSQGNMYMATGINVDYRDQCNIFKLSRDGVLKWLNTLMDAQGNPMDCIPADIHLSDQGNIYIGGSKHPYAYDRPLFTSKYDTLGNEHWLFDEAVYVPFSDGMVLSSDKNENIFIGAGLSDNQNILLKINSSGNKIWEKKENRLVLPQKITNLPSGNILLSGIAHEVTLFKSILYKYDSDGDLTRQIRYEGPGRIYNVPHVFKPDLNGNLFAVGFTPDNSGYQKNLIVKFNRAGKIEWDDNFHYSGFGHESIADISFDGQGNPVVTSTTGVYPHKIIIRKYDSKGATLWESVLFESDETSYGARKIISDTAGNIYLAGVKKLTQSHYCILVKYNPSGQFLWSRVFGNDQHDYFDYNPSYLNLDLEGNIIMAGGGNYQDNNGIDFETFGFIVKTDPTGNLRLDKKISDESGWLSPLQCESDMFDNILMACLVRTPGPGCHYVKLFKLNRFGNVQWKILLNDERVFHYQTEKIQTDERGNIYLLGEGYGAEDSYLTQLLKVDHQGKIIWKNDLHDYPDGLVTDTEGNCYTTLRDGTLSKYNTNGILRWSEDISIEQPMRLDNIFIGDSADVIIGMKTLAPWISNYSYFELLKLKQTISDDEYAKITSSATGTWINQNFPNPFNGITHFQYSIGKPGKVTIKVYNSLGQQIETVLDQYQESREYLGHWIPKNLSSGTYYIRIKSADYNKTIRVSYLK